MDQAGNTEQVFSTLARFGLGPNALVRLAGGLDRSVDVLVIGFGYRREDLFVCWVERGKVLVRTCGNEFAVDEAKVFEDDFDLDFDEILLCKAIYLTELN